VNAISSDKGTSPTGLTGTLTVPGDKSISHRALMIGALAVGETTITGLLEGEDVLATAAAMQQLGAEIEQKEGTWHVTGRGIGGLIEPAGVLDLGNSGTAARLLMGVLASHDLTATMTGDASLSSRPMERVMEPLRHIGAEFTARSGGQLPITITGTPSALPGDETLKVASAQVKSAILLAGLNAAGNTIVVEPRPSRDHTEKMLSFFGADVRSEENTDGSRKITLVGQPEITGRDIVVPGDISSAAFPIVAALITPGSDVTIENVGINPLRAGLLDSLSEMGADIEIKNTRDIAGEPVADLQVRASQLKGATIPASRAPAMIDEYPILAVAAACAEGTSIFEGVGELRVKESDRLAAMAEGLQECGVETAATEDTLTIYGTDKIPGKIAGGVTIASQLDHRIAMSYLVLGLASENPVTIDDGSPIETSFPGFLGLMNKLGATMAEAT
jgi:3-phosphoshikimate 1-carboxyvinyltransferase